MFNFIITLINLSRRQFFSAVGRMVFFTSCILLAICIILFCYQWSIIRFISEVDEAGGSAGPFSWYLKRTQDLREAIAAKDVPDEEVEAGMFTLATSTINPEVLRNYKYMEELIKIRDEKIEEARANYPKSKIIPIIDDILQQQMEQAGKTTTNPDE